MEVGKDINFSNTPWNFLAQRGVTSHVQFFVSSIAKPPSNHAPFPFDHIGGADTNIELVHKPHASQQICFYRYLRRARKIVRLKSKPRRAFAQNHGKIKIRIRATERSNGKFPSQRNKFIVKRTKIGISLHSSNWENVNFPQKLKTKIHFFFNGRMAVSEGA